MPAAPLNRLLTINPARIAQENGAVEMSEAGGTAVVPVRPGVAALPSMGQIGAFARRSDLLLAFGIMGILVVLVFPLPPILLDLLLAVSIIVSVLILMTSLFIEDPLEFTVFPTVLLIETMSSVALNRASTRPIRAPGRARRGSAPRVSEARGNLVFSGNFLIGAIMSAILLFVRFVVISNG